MFVLAIIFVIITVILAAGWFVTKNGWVALGGGISLILSLFFLWTSTFYTIEPGEAKVLKNWTGEIVGSEFTTGAHYKAPWVDAIDFDIRNQLSVFLGDGNQSYNGSPTNGPQISFNDKDGVAGNLDLVVLYSIKADNVENLVDQYSNQDDFKTKVIEQDIRSTPREIPGQYTTIQMLTQRSQVTKAIRDALEKEWADKGIIIEDVSLQDVRYSDGVKQRFEDAQNAQTEVVKAQAELEKTKVDAQQRVVEAQAQADANALLSASLTPQILQQRWIDAVSKSGTIIVPQNFTSLGNLVPQQ